MSIHPSTGEPLHSLEQLEALLAPNLEHAAQCVETAHQVSAQMGALSNLNTVETAVEHALHFLRLAQGYLKQLRKQQADEAEQSSAP